MFKLSEILEKFKQKPSIPGGVEENKASASQTEGQVSVKQVRNGSVIFYWSTIGE